MPLRRCLQDISAQLLQMGPGYRYRLRPVTAIVTLALIAAMLATATAEARKKSFPSKTWNLASEFPLIRQNPVGGTHGWYFNYGKEDLSRRYRKMPYFFGAAAEEAACGVKSFYEWNKEDEIGGTPAIWYNDGPTVDEGQDTCAPLGVFPTKTVFMIPERDTEAENAAIVTWRSPITGTVTVSGSIQLVEEQAFKAMKWELDRGATRLVGPVNEFSDTPTSFGPMVVSITKNQTLSLEVCRQRPEVSGQFDSTAVNLVIEYAGTPLA